MLEYIATGSGNWLVRVEMGEEKSFTYLPLRNRHPRSPDHVVRRATFKHMTKRIASTMVIFLRLMPGFLFETPTRDVFSISTKHCCKSHEKRMENH